MANTCVGAVKHILGAALHLKDFIKFCNIKMVLQKGKLCCNTKDISALTLVIAQDKNPETTKQMKIWAVNSDRHLSTKGQD